VPERTEQVREESDSLLIRRMAAGDHGAAAELFRRYRTAMLRLSNRIAREVAVAEDAVQDACLQAWRQADRYDASRGSVQVWLLVITRGRVMDRLRARVLRESHIKPGFDVDTATAPATSFDGVLDERARFRVVATVMDFLPPADRRTLELAYYQGLTHTEIAAHLDVPLGTAKTQLRRGLQTLRKATDGRDRRPFVWGDGGAGFDALPLEGLSLLVVDDDADTLKLTTLVLERAGAVVLPTARPERAVDRMESVWPDVALIDLEMPELDGCDVLALLRSRSAKLDRVLPAIAFSAHAADLDRHRTRSAGFDLHLAKPVSPSLLVRSIAALVSR
jgi:RNA polymerase sigma-70 factor (ECF subfamily)